jgi:16S rRNA (cytosine967-C5)-methyltransferase
MARSASRGHAARKAAGFVNGVLRGIGRLVRGHDPQAALARDALPHPDGGAVRLTEPILPDPADGLPAFLGAAYSLPDWLVASWLEAHGDAAEAICRWSNRRPRTFARVHAGQADRAADLPPGPLPGTVDASHLEPETLERLIADGVLTVQDPSAMAAVDALAPRAGESVLDLCASPGTKTMQIAEATGAGGRVVACDRSDEKLDPLRRAVAAQHVAGATVCLASDAAAAAPPGGFDAALVDAPCSNTGVLARRVEARWRLKPGDSDELAAVQRGLVAQAAELVRPGGRLVYSTCSLQPRENGGVVDAFIAEHAGWRLEKSALALPGPDHDGAFWALLVRQS